jgi:hypothetical protein
MLKIGSIWFWRTGMFEGSGGWRGVGETGEWILEWNSGGSVMGFGGSGEGGRYQGGQSEDTDIRYSAGKHMAGLGERKRGEEVGCDGEFAWCWQDAAG